LGLAATDIESPRGPEVSKNASQILGLIGLRSSEGDLQSLRQKEITKYEVQVVFQADAQSLKQKGEQIVRKSNLGLVEYDVHVVIVCPLYKTLRGKYSDLFRDATNLNSAFSSAQVARFLYDCYLMHVESVAET
jgi:hypothetical protein